MKYLNWNVCIFFDYFDCADDDGATEPFFFALALLLFEVLLEPLLTFELEFAEFVVTLL